MNQFNAILRQFARRFRGSGKQMPAQRASGRRWPLSKRRLEREGTKCSDFENQTGLKRPNRDNDRPSLRSAPGRDLERLFSLGNSAFYSPGLVPADGPTLRAEGIGLDPGKTRCTIELTVTMPEQETTAPERDRAAEDVWERTISQIPTTFGKIAYLASLRNENSGRYQHFGLARVYSEEEADRVLRECHQGIFADWLAYSLVEQKRDLEAYLNSIEDDRATVLSTWADIRPYANFAPADTVAAEHRLYVSDLELILELLRNELSPSS